MTGAWWELVPAVTTTWTCGADEHLLRWEDGELVLDAHPDPVAEATLGALGGARPTCLRIAAAWRERRHDPLLLTLGRRPGEAHIGIAPGPGARLVEREDADARDRLLLLFSLPPSFIDRLVLTAAAHAATRWPDAAFRRQHGLRLGAALAARATPALRRLAQPLARVDEPMTVQAAPAAAGDPPRVHAERTGAGLSVSGTLPLSWISRVWGPGISEPDARMVLGRGAVRGDASSVEVDVDVAAWREAAAGEWEVDPGAAVLHRAEPEGPWSVRTPRPG